MRPARSTAETMPISISLISGRADASASPSGAARVDGLAEAAASSRRCPPLGGLRQTRERAGERDAGAEQLAEAVIEALLLAQAEGHGAKVRVPPGARKANPVTRRR